MIIIVILVAVFVAFVVACLLVGSMSSVDKKARKIVASGQLIDEKEARRLLAALSARPATMRSRETDELCDGLQRLLEKPITREEQIASSAGVLSDYRIESSYPYRGDQKTCVYHVNGAPSDLRITLIPGQMSARSTGKAELQAGDMVSWKPGITWFGARCAEVWDTGTLAVHSGDSEEWAE